MFEVASGAMAGSVGSEESNGHLVYSLGWGHKQQAAWYGHTSRHGLRHLSSKASTLNLVEVKCESAWVRMGFRLA